MGVTQMTLHSVGGGAGEVNLSGDQAVGVHGGVCARGGGGWCESDGIGNLDLLSKVILTG